MWRTFNTNAQNKSNTLEVLCLRQIALGSITQLPGLTHSLAHHVQDHANSLRHFAHCWAVHCCTGSRSEDSSSEESATSDSDSDVTLHLTILEGPVTPSDFTAAVAAALSPFALDQEGPASSQLSMSPSSVVALCFANSGGRTSPTDFAPFVSTGSAAVVALCSTIPRGRASATDLTSPAATATLVAPPALDPEDPASPGDTPSTDSVVALYFTNPGGRA